MHSSHTLLFHSLNHNKLSTSLGTMAGIIGALDILSKIFDKYAAKEGAKDTLTKAELSELLCKEFGIKDKDTYDEFFRDLDNDGNGVVNFQEYVTFVAAIGVLIKK